MAVLQVYKVEKYLVRVVMSLYDGLRAYLRWSKGVGEYFGVKRGLETAICNVPVVLQCFH